MRLIAGAAARRAAALGLLGAAGGILRSSVLEPSVAMLVLVTTSVLVSLPSPKPPGPPPGAAPAAP